MTTDSSIYSRSMGRQTRNPRRSPTTPTSAPFDGPGLPPPLPPAIPGGQKPLYLCSPFVEAALVKGNFKTIAMLPKYVEVTEWVAVNSNTASAAIPSLVI